MLGAWGGDEFDTPNLDRFAERAIRFTNHYSGSLPCVPARHDLLCGAWDFLWKPWGSIEIWEEPLTEALRREGVCTKLVSDHPHLFESGGENYHVGFTAWDYQRGHEGDPWRTRPDPSWVGTPSFGRGWLPYDTSRGWFRSEEDFPGPKTMAAAARWLAEEAPVNAEWRAATAGPKSPRAGEGLPDQRSQMSVLRSRRAVSSSDGFAAHVAGPTVLRMHRSRSFDPTGSSYSSPVSIKASHPLERSSRALFAQAICGSTQ